MARRRLRRENGADANDGDRYMRAPVSKIAFAALTALALAVATLSLATPAQAQHWRGGGGHGWRGGGGWGIGIYPGYYGYGYGYGYPYGDGCLAYRPVYNRYGEYIGRRLVNVCY
jgi:hypothetical protein